MSDIIPPMDRAFTTYEEVGDWLQASWRRAQETRTAGKRFTYERLELEFRGGEVDELSELCALLGALGDGTRGEDPKAAVVRAAVGIALETLRFFEASGAFHPQESDADPSPGKRLNCLMCKHLEYKHPTIEALRTGQGIKPQVVGCGKGHYPHDGARSSDSLARCLATAKTCEDYAAMPGEPLRPPTPATPVDQRLSCLGCRHVIVETGQVSGCAKGNFTREDALGSVSSLRRCLAKAATCADFEEDAD